MKQVWYEWKKMISDKSVLLVVVLSMCIVLGYQWKNADSYAWQRNESYREYYEDALTTVEKKWMQRQPDNGYRKKVHGKAFCSRQHMEIPIWHSSCYR